jgi:hypothetical protein
MDNQAKILKSLTPFLGNGGPNGIGICYRGSDGKFVTLPNHGCEPFRRDEFVKTAPEGVFLFGGTVVCELRSGIVLSPDRRGGGRLMATANGWGQAGETGEEAASREFFQEVCAWLEGMDLPAGDPNRFKRVQLVPKGIKLRTIVPMLGVTLTSYREVGALQFVDVNVNDSAKVVEFIYRWRLGEGLTEVEEKELLRMIWSEQMDKNPNDPNDLGETYLGTNFVVVNPETKEYVGTLCGRQPLLKIPQLSYHPAVAMYMTQNSP